MDASCEEISAITPNNEIDSTHIAGNGAVEQFDRSTLDIDSNEVVVSSSEIYPSSSLGESDAPISLFDITLSKLSPNSLREFLKSQRFQQASKDVEINRLRSQVQSLEDKLANFSQEKLTFEETLLCKTKELDEERALRKSESALAEEKLRKHDEAAKRAIQTYQQDVNAKLLEASKQIEDIRKERENAVMRFAQAEQQVIDSKVLAEKYEAQCKLAVKEKDFFQERMKMLTEERKKMQTFIDQKTLEVVALQKEARDAKESAKEADMRLKAALAKAKIDQDNQQELRLRLERVQQQLIEVKTELEHTKQDLNDKEQKHKSDKEQSELQRQHENFQQRMELAEINERLRFELDSLKQKHRDALEENITLKDRVLCLDSELGICNKELTMLKSEVASLKEEAVSAREDTAAARERAGELVNHNQQLSLFRSQIQAETSGLRENLADLQRDFANITEENNRLKTETASLMAELAEERRASEMTVEHLKSDLATVRLSSEDFQKRLQEQESLLISTRRKHLREVKELQRLLRGQQPQSVDQPHLDVNSTTRGLSRASSNNSIQDQNTANHHHSSSSKNGEQPHSYHCAATSSSMDPSLVSNGSDHQIVIVGGGSNNNDAASRQQVIEKIVGLQRALAKKSERLDFLNEQVRCLTDEVQKKSRIIQSLATRDSAESGALANDAMDRHKAAMARRSGIMASVLSSELHDGKMTLDLSLEITRKLQEVLEETLLKNIMLKESLDTLGHEISHLSKENRDLKLTIKGVFDKELAGAASKK